MIALERCSWAKSIISGRTARNIMSRHGGTCGYVARKDDPSNWHGEKPDDWRLDREPPAGLDKDVWRCPHDALKDEAYCAFHTDPDDIPAETDEGELFIEAINETSASDDDEVARRKKQFIGATFGPFDIEAATLDAGDDHQIRFDHATFTAGIRAEQAKIKHSLVAQGVRFDTGNEAVSGEIGVVSFNTSEFGGNNVVVFTDAEFIGDGGISFGGAQFSGDGRVDFGGVQFSGNNLFSFNGAEFSGDGPVKFDDAKFTGNGNVSFIGAEFGGDSPVEFDDAEFTGDGWVSFRDAEFSGDSPVNFDDAEFSGDGWVSFRDAEFRGDGDVSFWQSEFSGDGRVKFERAKFTGNGDVWFSGADFSGDGDVSFWQSEFSGDGDVDFGSVQFRRDGWVSFWEAEFTGSGRVLFEDAKFTGGGDVSFKEAKFTGDADVLFKYTEFTGDGDLSFSNVRFNADGEILFSELKVSNDLLLSFDNADIDSICRFNDVQFTPQNEVIFTGAEVEKKLIFERDADKLPTVLHGRFDFSNAILQDNLSFRCENLSTTDRSEGDDERPRFDVVFADAVNFSGATFEEPPDFSTTRFPADADFTDAMLQNADFQNADLTGTDQISTASFDGADLSGVNFTGTTLTGASFERALLSRAELLGADLTRTKLYGALLGDGRINRQTRFWLRPDAPERVPDNARLPIRTLRMAKTKLRRYSRRAGSEPYCVYDPRYRGADGEPDLERAAETYGTLETVARQNSLPGLASECFLGRKDVQLKQYWRDSNWLMVLRSAVPTVVARYGESPTRVLGTGAVTVLVCALVYSAFGLIEHGDTGEKATLFESFYFSALTFTTLGYGDFNPVTVAGRILAVVETSVGVVVLAILVFVFGRRATR
jgi:uncharacterized protein YjbI with pentapeptide repeats